MVSAWNIAVAVALGLALPASAAAKPGKPVQLAELDLLTDGRGHYLAIRPSTFERQASAPASDNVRNAAVYMGNGKLFYRVQAAAEDSIERGSKKPYLLTFRDARFLPADPKESSNSWRTQHIVGKGRAVTVRCGRSTLEFTPVDARRRRKILAVATQKEVFPRRVPRLLARDNLGSYYYVDQHVDGSRKYDRHLYVGRRGRMKRVKLRNVVVDAAGSLYVSRKGTLRVERNARQRDPVRVLWLDKNKEPGTALTNVSTHWSGTINFISTDLGVFIGKKRGTPCDWL
jgi:hypothetical protein